MPVDLARRRPTGPIPPPPGPADMGPTGPLAGPPDLAAAGPPPGGPSSVQNIDRIEITPAHNGGFIVECFKKPSAVGSKNALAIDMEGPKRYSYSSFDELVTGLQDELGIAPAPGTEAPLPGAETAAPSEIPAEETAPPTAPSDMEGAGSDEEEYLPEDDTEEESAEA